MPPAAYRLGSLTREVYYTNGISEGLNSTRRRFASITIEAAFSAISSRVGART